MPSITLSPSGASGSGWDNPTYVSTDDNNWADASILTSQTSRTITITFPNAGLDPTDVITGVEISMIVRSQNGDGYLSAIRLNSGPTRTSNLGTNWPNSETTRVLGDASDTWNMSLTPADFNSGSSVMLTTKQNGRSAVTVYIDYVSLTIHYLPGNTSPAFVTQPTVSHGSLSVLSPSNPNATVSFNTYDAEQSSLAYTIKKAGTTVKSGTIATGAQVLSLAYNATGLAEGDNSLVMTIDDGNGGTDTSTAFVVTVDTIPPSISSAGVVPDPVTSTTYKVSISATDAGGSMDWQWRTGSGGSGVLLASGTKTSDPYQTPTITDATLVHGSNTRYLRLIDRGNNITDQTVTVNAVLITKIAAPMTLSLGLAGSLSDLLRMGESSPTGLGLTLGGVDRVVMHESQPALLGLSNAGQTLLAIRTSLSQSLGLLAGGVDALHATEAGPHLIRATMAGQDSVRSQVTSTFRMGLRASMLDRVRTRETMRALLGLLESGSESVTFPTESAPFIIRLAMGGADSVRSVSRMTTSLGLRADMDDHKAMLDPFETGIGVSPSGRVRMWLHEPLVQRIGLSGSLHDRLLMHESGPATIGLLFEGLVWDPSANEVTEATIGVSLGGAVSLQMGEAAEAVVGIETGGRVRVVRVILAPRSTRLAVMPGPVSSLLVERPFESRLSGEDRIMSWLSVER